MKLYTLKDEKLGYCSEPFVAHDDKQAMMSLRDACAAPNGIFLRARVEQSTLICLGDFDPCECTFDVNIIKVCPGISIPFYEVNANDAKA